MGSTGYSELQLSGKTFVNQARVRLVRDVGAAGAWPRLPCMLVGIWISLATWAAGRLAGNRAFLARSGRKTAPNHIHLSYD